METSDERILTVLLDRIPIDPFEHVGGYYKSAGRAFLLQIGSSNPMKTHVCLLEPGVCHILCYTCLFWRGYGY